MRAKILPTIGIAVLALSFSTYAQVFTNLNFERATVQINDPTYGFLNWGLAVPGWSHSPGSDSGIVYYGSPHLGISGYFLLMDSNSPAYAPGTQLAGRYSLTLRSGHLLSYDPSSPWQNAFISQTGDIASGVQSLRLLAKGPFEVDLGGVPINMISLGGNLYAGDISSFAGTTEELRIVNIGFNEVVLDNITFSTLAVPEPSTVALTGMGFLLLCRRKLPSLS